jgi:hypothetical protein
MSNMDVTQTTWGQRDNTREIMPESVCIRTGGWNGWNTEEFVYDG